MQVLKRCGGCLEAGFKRTLCVAQQAIGRYENDVA
jgi:hypothetical protein